ncbi:hypothetical protein GON09_000029 [Rhodococcus sp. B50]|nr:hypothetical protein [Rhodococcus sp. B50]
MNAAAPIPTVMVTPANHMDPLTAVTFSGTEAFLFLCRFVHIIVPIVTMRTMIWEGVLR